MQNSKNRFKTITKFLLVLLLVGTSLGVLPNQKAQAATQYGVSFVSFTGETTSGGAYTYTNHETQMVWGGNKPTRPADPSRTGTGYEFDNWYTDDTYSSLFNFNAPINAPTNVYGRWLKSVQFIAYNESTGSTGGGKIALNGSFPNSGATLVGPSVSFTQKLYDDYSYSYSAVPDNGYYFKGWSFNSASGEPQNFRDLTIPLKDLNIQYGNGDLTKVYAVFAPMASSTATWTATENKLSGFKREYSVSFAGQYPDGLYYLEDSHNITQTHWEDLVDGKLPENDAYGNPQYAKFVITLKDNVPLGSYNVVLYDNVGHSVTNITIVVKHDVVRVVPHAATCTSPGNKEYWWCETHNKFFSDVNCTTETTEAAMQIPALGHDFGAWEYYNATYHRHRCSRVYGHYEDQNHTWDNGVITAQPTTTTEGIKTYTCTGCSGTKTESVPTLPNVEITLQPIDYIGLEGSKARFTLVATGEGLSYQWQYSDDDGRTWNNSSVKISTYSATLTTAKDNRMLRCIVSDASGNSITSNAARMTIQYPPVITKQPVDYVGPNQSKAKFTLVATGEGLSYQWQYSDDGGKTWNNSSVKISTYSTTLTTAKDNRMLRCIVSDAYGNSAISDAARMTIQYPPVITKQPVDYVGPNQSKAKFTLVATGEGLSYQWQYSDDDGRTWNNSSVKISTYSTTLTTAKDNRMLRCIVSDAYGNSAISDAARMTIQYPPVITKQPVDYVGPDQSKPRFAVVATGEGLSYQWQYSDDDGITWNNSSVKIRTYSTTLTTAKNNRMLRCIVLDGYGNSVISNAVRMTIHNPLEITE